MHLMLHTRFALRCQNECYMLFSYQLNSMLFFFKFFNFTDEVAELRREVAALKREVLSLKKSQKEKTRKDKSKNSKQKENQKKIVDEVKRMEKTVSVDS